MKFSVLGGVLALLWVTLLHGIHLLSYEYKSPLSVQETDLNNVPKSEFSTKVYRYFRINYMYKKQTPWPLDRKRTIPTERPPLVGEI
jgi:hypothetical protein